MAGTMKAAIVHQFNKPPRIEQVGIPKPAERNAALDGDHCQKPRVSCSCLRHISSSLTILGAYDVFAN